jgi:hypothetical protein
VGHARRGAVPCRHGGDHVLPPTVAITRKESQNAAAQGTIALRAAAA